MSDIDNPQVVENNPAPVAPNQGSVEPPASTTGPAETADGEQPQTAEATEAKPKRDRSAEKRISRLTQQREAAIREAGYWRGIAEASSPKQADQTADGERPQQQEQARQQTTYTKEDERAAKAAIERVREAGEDIEDFEDVMDAITSDELPVTKPMVEFLLATEHPAPMARWMSENAKEVARIAMLPRELAYRALERAEARLANKPAPKTTNAPPPPPTVNGRGAPQFNPEKASMDDYEKHWKERRAKAGYR